MVIQDLEHLGFVSDVEAVYGRGSVRSQATSSTLVIGQRTIARALTLALAQTLADGTASALAVSRSSASAFSP